MTDRKPREFWIRRNTSVEPTECDILLEPPKQELIGNYRGHYLFVREVLPDVDSKPPTINLKFPEFNDRDAYSDGYLKTTLEPKSCDFMTFEDGARYQHEIDAQHFEAIKDYILRRDVMVAELMEIVEMQRSGIVEIQAILCDEDNDGDFPERAIGQALEYSQHKILAAVDERLAKLKVEK